MFLRKIAFLSTASALVVDTALADDHASQQSVDNPISQLPRAEAGQCFVRLQMPAEFKDEVEKKLVHRRRTIFKPRPASFEPDAIKVKVKDEAVRFEVRQPVWEERLEKVMVKPGFEEVVVKPAIYKDVVEEVLVGEPRFAWKATDNLSAAVKAGGGRDGQIYCLDEVPGRTVKITKRVLVSPQKVKRVAKGATFIEVKKKVLVDPGGVEKVPVPAEYATIEGQRLAMAAGVTSREEAAKFKDVTREVLVKPERFEWIEVSCATNSHDLVPYLVQDALKKRGHYKGEIDGVIGPLSAKAISLFQDEAGIAHQGILSIDTLKALGIDHMTRPTDFVIPKRERAARKPKPAAPLVTPPLAPAVEDVPSPKQAEPALRGRAPGGDIHTAS